MALPLVSLNHVSRVVHDTEVTRDFYQRVLGFVEVKRPDSFEFEGSWLYGLGIGLHLIEGTPITHPQSAINPKSDHLSFVAESLELVEARLAEHGITFIRETVREGSTTVSQIFFHDPDGFMIEICNCDCLPVLPLSAISCPLTKLAGPDPAAQPLSTPHGAPLAHSCAEGAHGQSPPPPPRSGSVGSACSEQDVHNASALPQLLQQH